MKFDQIAKAHDLADELKAARIALSAKHPEFISLEGASDMHYPMGKHVNYPINKEFWKQMIRSHIEELCKKLESMGVEL